jgi:hypothetical protein
MPGGPVQTAAQAVFRVIEPSKDQLRAIHAEHAAPPLLPARDHAMTLI